MVTAADTAFFQVYLLLASPAVPASPLPSMSIKWNELEQVSFSFFHFASQINALTDPFIDGSSC